MYFASTLDGWPQRPTPECCFLLPAESLAVQQKRAAFRERPPHLNRPISRSAVDRQPSEKVRFRQVFPSRPSTITGETYRVSR